MATIFSDKDANSLAYALVSAFNTLHDGYAASVVQFHRDLTSTYTGSDYTNPTSTVLTVTAASATNLATSITLVNNILGVFHSHCKDDSSHLIKDTVNDPQLDGYSLVVTTGVTMTDTAAVVVNVNALKILFNAHLTQAGVHVNNDGTNTVSTAAATDLASAETLLNAMKTAVNAHMASGPSFGRIRLK